MFSHRPRCHKTHTMFAPWDVCAAGAIAIGLFLVAIYVAIEAFRTKL
jgi:hypothetical protein